MSSGDCDVITEQEMLVEENQTSDNQVDSTSEDMVSVGDLSIDSPSVGQCSNYLLKHLDRDKLESNLNNLIEISHFFHESSDFSPSLAGRLFTPI